MNFLMFLGYIIPALGLFALIDYLVKKTKTIETKPKKYLYYLLQIIAGIISLYLYYKAAELVSNYYGRNR